MAKQIRWTNQAKLDRINILNFYRKRNKSTAYSKKLNRIFIHEIEIIAQQSEIGKQSNSENVRVKVTGNYYLIYMIEGDVLFVLRIWDTRQN